MFEYLERPAIIAHRGASAFAPENTLAAFQKAIELKADGIEFDVNGNLYAAYFGGKAVYVFSPEGKLLQKIETPGSKPTNLEFGDDDLKTLYLTEVETNSLYKIKTTISGKK